MAAHHDRMHSIKLIHPDHLKYPHLTEDFDGTDGRWSLMNFSSTGRGPATAANLPIGHRSLVYLIHHKKFIWAIEFTGSLDEGQKSAAAHGLQPDSFTHRWGLFRPIHFLARIALDAAPTPKDIERRCGYRFTPNTFTLKYISAEDYQRIYDAIGFPLSTAPRTSASCKVNLLSQVVALDFELPPIPGAESLLHRIRGGRALPERNMEDVVKSFLLLLGHRESCICFQVGRVDVRVNDVAGKPLMAIEVKRSLQSKSTHLDARRKGFDYAGATGAPLVVLTDADSYEIYDRRCTGDYDAMLRGRFQLTRFTRDNLPALNLLKPTVS